MRWEDEDQETVPFFPPEAPRRNRYTPPPPPPALWERLFAGRRRSGVPVSPGLAFVQALLLTLALVCFLAALALLFG